MSSINKVILVGNVGADPEIKATQDGREIANISLATSERWKDKSGQQQEKTEWHKVIIFNEGLVNVVRNYIRKGSKLYIEGSIQTRKWQDKEGNDRYSTEVVLKNYNGTIVMLDSKQDRQDYGGDVGTYKGQSSYADVKPATGNSDTEYGISEDEMPF